MVVERKLPPWVDPRTPDRPWVDVQQAAPWLRLRPYLVDVGRRSELEGLLTAAGFVVVEAHVPAGAEEPERVLLQDLSRQLEFDELGAGNWAAFNDRLGDFLSASESTPHAVLVGGLDHVAETSTYHFVRCIHNLLALTEGIGLSDVTANRQIEYFFVGRWKALDEPRSP